MISPAEHAIIESGQTELLKRYREARKIWEQAGCGEDFCVSRIGSKFISFGSTNRVHWSRKHGYQASAKRCTARFLNAFQGLHGQAFC